MKKNHIFLTATFVLCALMVFLLFVNASVTMISRFLEYQAFYPQYYREAYDNAFLIVTTNDYNRSLLIETWITYLYLIVLVALPMIVSLITIPVAITTKNKIVSIIAFSFTLIAFVAVSVWAIAIWTYQDVMSIIKVVRCIKGIVLYRNRYSGYSGGYSTSSYQQYIDTFVFGIVIQFITLFKNVACLLLPISGFVTFCLGVIFSFFGNKPKQVEEQAQ